jgi:hypothetical protein
MRSFFLAAILLAIGATALVLVGLNTLSGIYADGNVREFETVYQTLGWAKYGGLLLLLWLADRAVLWRERLGWKRSLLLWLPFVLFCAAGYFQWVVMGNALRDYLAANGQPESVPAAPVFYMAVVFPLAFAFTGINAWMVQRRQLRLTSVGLRRSV